MSKVEFINDAYTEDGLKLPMVHFSSIEKDICVICIHGMCGTIIDNYFATVWGDILSENNIGFIYEHNRGHSIENDIVMQDGSLGRYGCRYEIFEECLYDLDLALTKARDLGYKKIILLGHSLGCNKVIYYYYKKRSDILGIILASAPDMIGAHVLNDPDYEQFIVEAKSNIDNNEPKKLLHKLVDSYMHFSSETYYNWFKKNSNLDNLPVVRNPKQWEQFKAIDIPILTFSGSKEAEYYLQFELLKEKAVNCQNFEYRIISGSGHTYKKKEIEIGELIINWIKNNF